MSAETPDTLALRCGAAMLFLRQSAVFCGLTAAHLYGLAVPYDQRSVHVALPKTLDLAPRSAGLISHRYHWRPEDLRDLGGLLVPKPAPLFFELAGLLPRLDLISAGDQLTRTHCAIDDLRGWLPRAAKRRGAPLARAVLPHLEPQTYSPAETKLRMLLIDAGLPRPAANPHVFDGNGHRLHQPDLAYFDARIAIDYDGAHHDKDPWQLRQDRASNRLLTLEGWLPLRYDKEQLYGRQWVIVDDVREALRDRTPRSKGG